jgi:hypothetical protein
MAEYSNTVKNGINPRGKSNNGAKQSAMRCKTDAAATSERQRASSSNQQVSSAVKLERALQVSTNKFIAKEVFLVPRPTQNDGQ